jgi:hypothetical protein
MLFQGIGLEQLKLTWHYLKHVTVPENRLDQPNH